MLMENIPDWYYDDISCKEADIVGWFVKTGDISQKNAWNAWGINPDNDVII